MKFFSKKVFIIGVVIIATAVLINGQRQILKKVPIIKLSTVKAELKSSVKYYNGVCPETIKMTGTIIVPGPMSIKYSFLRSDGVVVFPGTVNFSTKGSKNIPFVWSIEKDYKGWVEFIVKTPTGEVRSGKTEFMVKCKEEKKIIPGLNNRNMTVNKMPVQMVNRENLPDLQVMDILLKDDGKIQIIIRNNGPGKLRPSFPLSGQPLKLQLFRDGKEWGSMDLNSIKKRSKLENPGDQIAFLWFPNVPNYKLPEGKCELKAVVDSDRSIVEKNKNNNSLSRHVNFIKLPDLEIKSIFLGGKDCSIFVVIRNNGPGKLDISAYDPGYGVSVQMDKNGNPMGGFSLNSIDKNRVLMNPDTQILCDWGGPGFYSLYDGDGQQELKAIVDQYDIVTETNEQNNTLTRTLKCE